MESIWCRRTIAAWLVLVGFAGTARADSKRVAIVGRLDFDDDKLPYRVTLDLPTGWHRLRTNRKQIYLAAFEPDNDGNDARLELRVAVLGTSLAKLPGAALAARLAQIEIDDNVGADCGECIPYETHPELVTIASGPAILLKASGLFDGHPRRWRTLIVADGRRAFTLMFSRTVIGPKLERVVRSLLQSFAIDTP